MDEDVIKAAAWVLYAYRSAPFVDVDTRLNHALTRVATYKPGSAVIKGWGKNLDNSLKYYQPEMAQLAEKLLKELELHG